MAPKDYDADELTLAIARGDRTYRQISEAFGLSEAHVGQIARGERRPELQAKIRAATGGFLDDARRLAAQSAQDAVASLRKIMAADSGAPEETKRKAAVDILKLTLDGSDPAGAARNDPAGSPAGVAPGHVQEFYQYVADRHGGPPDKPPVAKGKGRKRK